MSLKQHAFDLWVCSLWPAFRRGLCCYPCGWDSGCGAAHSSTPSLHQLRLPCNGETDRARAQTSTVAQLPRLQVRGWGAGGAGTGGRRTLFLTCTRPPSHCPAAASPTRTGAERSGGSSSSHRDAVLWDGGPALRSSLPFKHFPKGGSESAVTGAKAQNMDLEGELQLRPSQRLGKPSLGRSAMRLETSLST